MEFVEVLGLSISDVWAIIAACVFMLIDLITGYLGAWVNHDIQSSKMREGLAHKTSMLLIIIVMWFMELFVAHTPELNFTLPLIVPACVLICFMELNSIGENILKINPNLKDTALFDFFKHNTKKD